MALRLVVSDLTLMIQAQMMHTLNPTESNPSENINMNDIGGMKWALLAQAIMTYYTIAKCSKKPMWHRH